MSVICVRFLNLYLAKNFHIIWFIFLYLLYFRFFCCGGRNLEEKKVSFPPPLFVTLGITLTLVNVVQKGGFFSFSILFNSIPPDKKLIEISFATHR